MSSCTPATCRSPGSSRERTLERAFDLEDRFELSWWDALIVSSAQLQSCQVLLSEDLEEGQRFDDLVVVNPFATEPPATHPR